MLRLARLPNEGQALLLQMARLAIQQRALETGWTGILDRARSIQRSLLPDPLPEPVRLRPGGALRVRRRRRRRRVRRHRAGPGRARAHDRDASGHGLPAALEARDVVIGLRMGAARHFKIDATIERLNRILCDSTLSSRFVSLVYGELDRAGWFDYINAGHPAPLVLTRHEVRSLPESGRVLGVSPSLRLPHRPRRDSSGRPAAALHRRGHRMPLPLRRGVRSPAPHGYRASADRDAGGPHRFGHLRRAAAARRRRAAARRRLAPRGPARGVKRTRSLSLDGVFARAEHGADIQEPDCSRPSCRGAAAADSAAPLPFPALPAPVALRKSNWSPGKRFSKPGRKPPAAATLFRAVRNSFVLRLLLRLAAPARRAGRS